MSAVVEAAKALRDACDALKLDVPYVYNPLDYAWAPHEAYARKFGKAAPRRAILVGMNPGPWGMGQTGVPFGDVQYVRDWMGITANVTQPARRHPKRPVTGFATTRREPSGSRLYGWAAERYGSAERFFAEFFIVNYCPLLFFDDEGRNLTPDKLPAREVAALDEACDEHLAAVIRALRPTVVVGVGAYAEAQARRVVDEESLAARVGRILHPSPASPAANQGWAAQAEAQLAALGIPLPSE